jgi:hypothetical protein
VFVGPKGYVNFEHKSILPEGIMLFIGLPYYTGQEEILFIEKLSFSSSAGKQMNS